MAVNVDEKHIRLFLGKLGILIITFLDNKDLFHYGITQLIVNMGMHMLQCCTLHYHSY
jgi:hypothetical protein